MVTLLALCAAVALPAHAADAPAPVVVASDGRVELVVSDDDGELCLGVRPGVLSVTACEKASTGIVVTGENGPVVHVGAAVPSSAASVEVRRTGRLVGTAATVPGEAYKGAAAGKVRFALARLAPGTPDDGLRVHAKDGAGRLVAVLTSLDGDLLLERRRLLRGRSGPVTWTLDDERTASLEPSVIDLAREDVRRCIELTLSSQGPLVGPSGQAICAGSGPRDSLGFEVDSARASLLDRCSPDVRLVYGVVPASVRRVTVVLGDGRRRSAQTTALNGGLWRAYALAIARRDAVRGVTIAGVGAPERFLRRAAAPLSVFCAGPDDETLISDLFLAALLNELPPVTPAGPVATIAGSPTIRVADGSGDTLCLAIGDRPFTPLGCAVISPSFESGPGALDRARDPTQFALAVPASVAAIRLSSADRSVVRTIPTVAGEAYTGRYAGFARFVAVAGADGRELVRLEMLDEAGAVLHEEESAGEVPFELANPRVLTARRVAGRIGGPSLWQTTLRTADETRHCLALTAGPRPAEEDRCQATRSDRSVLLSSSCAPRRLTVAVVAAPGTHVRADVDAASPRPLRLRNGVGLLTLPASKPLRALTLIRSGRARRVQIQAPAATRQCGWRTIRTIEQG